MSVSNAIVPATTGINPAAQKKKLARDQSHIFQTLLMASAVTACYRAAVFVDSHPKALGLLFWVFWALKAFLCKVFGLILSLRLNYINP